MYFGFWGVGESCNQPPAITERWLYIQKQSKQYNEYPHSLHPVSTIGVAHTFFFFAPLLLKGFYPIYILLLLML